MRVLLLGGPNDGQTVNMSRDTNVVYMAEYEAPQYIVDDTARLLSTRKEHIYYIHKLMGSTRPFYVGTESYSQDGDWILQRLLKGYMAGESQCLH